MVLALIITQGGITRIRHNEQDVNNFKIPDKFDLLHQAYIKENVENKIEENNNIFTITAYDLSISSCGKSRGNKGYGITKDGTNLQNHSWSSARTISSDPKLIPLGTKVELKFIDTNYKKYDGVYICRDAGSAIIQNKIDLFLGDFHNQKRSKEAINFGITQAIVTILKE
jgi:3D (Asp-Asp-Asp) domain-containing protein